MAQGFEPQTKNVCTFVSHTVNSAIQELKLLLKMFRLNGGDTLGLIPRLVLNCTENTVSDKSTIQELPFVNGSTRTLECHVHLKFVFR